MATSRRGIVLKRYADQQECNLRTLYRDLQALEAGGFPVCRDGTYYRLREGWLPAGAVLDTEEKCALYLARHLARGWKETTLGRALERVWAKLSEISGTGTLLLPDQWFSVRFPTAIDYAAHAHHLRLVEHALRERLALTTTYVSLAGETTTRTIEPGELHWDPALECLYLIAYCRLRRDVRVFAVHRFRMLALTEERIRCW